MLSTQQKPPFAYDNPNIGDSNVTSSPDICRQYYLHVLNSGSDKTDDSVDEAQQLLEAWYFVLKLTGRDLKLAKYYWTLQDYTWK